MNSPAPQVIPSLREWTARSGECLLTPSSRLIINVRSAQVSQVARLFQARLQRVTGIILPIVTGGASAPGDLVLMLAEAGVGSQGYVLDISDVAILSAETVTGLFYGTQTILQLLLQSPARCSLPAGTARDFPSFPQRALMLDLGRRYWSMKSLFNIIESMAWLKLNMLHLHFNDWNAFRLQSKQYLGLAAEESYDRNEIAALEAFAALYHVSIVPEIDLPAHATILTQYRPDLAFECDSMSKSRWPGGENGGWTINYADPAARAWMHDLIALFITWFDAHHFHIGTDEVPDGSSPDECDTLVDYARQRKYPHAGDVLVEWINEINALVKSHGKQLQIWNWWERSPHSINPDHDILVNAWVGQGHPDQFLQAGYRVINSPEDTHYVTPGLGLLPKPDYLYGEWQPNTHPNMAGYKICVWADKAEHESDAFFEAHLRLPRAILAERTWNHMIPSTSLAEFTTLFETIDNSLPLIDLRIDRRVREMLGVEAIMRNGKL